MAVMKRVVQEVVWWLLAIPAAIVLILQTLRPDDGSRGGTK
jgi:hypothetical protein